MNSYELKTVFLPFFLFLFFLSRDLLVPGCRIEIGDSAPLWNRAKKSSSRFKSIGVRLPKGVEQLNVLIEIRLELRVVVELSFFGLVVRDNWDDGFFLGRLESRDDAEQEFLFLDDEVDLRRPSLVPITEPETPMIKLPETDVPVGEEPERLFPEEPGLKRGGGGGGPLLCIFCFRLLTVFEFFYGTKQQSSEMGTSWLTEIKEELRFACTCGSTKVSLLLNWFLSLAVLDIWIWLG